MLTGDSTAQRKARGAFFTPQPIARFIADWAVTSPSAAVLEPSCGEAVFLREAGRGGRHHGPLVGVELHPASAAEAERSLRADGTDATIHTGDFFRLPLTERFDAIIGNPPYIRYHDFAGQDRLRARAAALRAGVRLTGLASSWAAFTVHAALHLKSGGRLGLVLPAELMTVNYAADVRQFLMDHFAAVRLVLFTERVFAGILEEVVLLLADGYDPTGEHGTDHCDMFQVKDASGLHDLSVAKRWAPPSRSAKWSAGLLSTDGLAAYAATTAGSGFTTLQSWGDTTLGMVTGNNAFFALSPGRARELGLSDHELLPLSPPGSRHLRALTFTRPTWERLGLSGQSTLLFRPPAEPSAAAKRYIAAGEARNVDGAYKCRVRSPWWRVPYLRPADLLLTYMNADTPRLAANRARAHHLNSVHGVYLRNELRADGTRLLPIASLNSVTLLGAEIIGRAYGGGILKLEPREADLLPVPSPALVRRHADPLARARNSIAAALRREGLTAAVALVDQILLAEGVALTASAIEAMRADYLHLSARRTARGKGD